MRLNFRLTFEATLWLIKKNIKTLVLLTLFNSIGIYIYTYAILPSFTPFSPSMKSTEIMSLSLKMFIFTTAIDIITSLLSFLEYAFLIVSVVSNSMTPSTPLIKQIRYIFSRIVPLAFTSLLSGLIVFLGTLLFCIPGLLIAIKFLFLGTLFFIIPGLIFSIKYSQALNFSLVDGVSPINALKYSARITKGNYLRLAWLYFLFSVVHMFLLIPIVLLPIPPFIKIGWYSFIFTLGILANYVIWKILKQNFYSGLGYPTISRGRKIIMAVLGIIIIIMIEVAIRSISASNSRFYNALNVGNILKQVTPSPTPTPSPSPTISSTPIPTHIPSPTDIPYPTPALIDLRETKEWQTYTNKSYGYSIRYPLDFIIQSLDSEPNIVKSLNVAVRSVDGKKYIAISAEDGSVEKKIREYGPLFLETEMSIPENDTTVMSTEGNASENPQYYAFIEKNTTHTLVIKLGPIPSGMEKEYKKFFSTIISTVTFKK